MPAATDRQGTWSLFAAPYGWLTGVSGTVVTDGEALEIDVPFEDFFGATRAALMLYFEARRQKLFAGYRALAYDLVTGEGADRNGTDLNQHGPIIGGDFLF